jgi:hypothetical protein
MSAGFEIMMADFKGVAGALVSDADVLKSDESMSLRSLSESAGEPNEDLIWTTSWCLARDGTRSNTKGAVCSSHLTIRFVASENDDFTLKRIFLLVFGDVKTVISELLPKKASSTGHGKIRTEPRPDAR